MFFMCVDKDGLTPLMLTCIHGFSATASLLVENKANVKAVDKASTQLSFFQTVVSFLTDEHWKFTSFVFSLSFIHEIYFCLFH